MRVQLALGVVLLCGVLLTGCLDGPEKNETAAKERVAPQAWFSPINDRGELDLIPSTQPPRETGPVCRVTEAADPYGVNDLMVDIDWTPTSDRTATLRLTAPTPDSTTGIFVEGPPPLNLTVSAFNVTAGDRFGLMVSLIGSETLDPVAEPQTFSYMAHYVAVRGPDRADIDLGLWTNECPNN